MTNGKIFNTKTYIYKKNLCTQIFAAALFITATNWTQFNVFQ